MQSTTTLTPHGVAHALRKPGGLLDQAEAALRRALAADPHNVRVLLQLGDLHRGKGDFPAALDLYRRLHALHPDHVAASWRSAILSGGRMPDVAPPGIRPAPFVRMTDFLTPAEQDRLLTLTFAGRERLIPAHVVGRGTGRVILEKRSAFLFEHRILRDVESWFGPKLRGVLPHILTRLRMDEAPGGGARGDTPPPPRYDLELHVTVHPAGGFYDIHRDDAGMRDNRRKLTFVYYFHREPKRFSGGDLLLYDTDLEADSGRRTAYSRIEPLQNSLVVFPSGYLHEVTSVECATDDFGDGRFTVNGWIRSRDEGEAANRSPPADDTAGSPSDPATDSGKSLGLSPLRNARPREAAKHDEAP